MYVGTSMSDVQVQGRPYDKKNKNQNEQFLYKKIKEMSNWYT